MALMRTLAYDNTSDMDPIHELQAEICRTLSHPARIAMLHLLAEEPREVGRLAEALGISQPNASKHLAVMRAAGWQVSRVVGNRYLLERRLGGGAMGQVFLARDRLLKKLSKAERMNVGAFTEDPVETFKRHVWVAPYYEEDIRALADRIGVSQVLMGSDFPHAEGLADPMSFADDLAGFDDAEVRQVMRENGRGLVTPRPA